MPTSRTLPTWLASFVVVAGLATVMAATGCAAPPGDAAVGSGEDAIGERPKAAGITEGSPQEEGVLLLVNDRAANANVLETRTGLADATAQSIVAFRTDAAGKPRWFSSIDEIDALPEADATTFQRLVADATTNGYVEAPGFDLPTLAKITVPNLSRPITQADVTIEAGFDGRTPADAAVVVRSRLTNTVDPSNAHFVSQTIIDNHKAFTLALNNFFVAVSPHRQFAAALKADRLTVIGTMSAVHPTFLIGEKAGVTTYYTRGDSGRYEAVPTPSYPVIMRARIRVQSTGLPDELPPGIRLFYPAWSAKVLAAPTGTVTEPGSG